MDGVRGEEIEVRLAAGDDCLMWSLPMDGGSGRRLGVRMRTLRDGLDIRLDVSREGVGGVGELPEVGDDERLGGIDSVAIDLASSGRRSALSLSRSGSAAVACSRTGRGAVGEEAKLGGDGCRDSWPPTPLSAGPCLFSTFSSVGAGAASLLSLLARCNVDARVRNVTLRLSGLSVSMGRYCDCGLKPDVAFRLVFSRMVSISCCRRTRQPKTLQTTGGRKDRTHHLLASMLLSALDHASPMLPYDHEQDGERHAPDRTAHNRRDGHGCTATARKRWQTRLC